MYGDNDLHTNANLKFVDESKRIEGYDGEIITVFVQKIKLPFIYFTPDKGYYPEWDMDKYYFYQDLSYPDMSSTFEVGKFYDVQVTGHRLMFIQEVSE